MTDERRERREDEETNPQATSECDGCGLLFEPCELYETPDEEWLCDNCRASCGVDTYQYFPGGVDR